jgi:hypothetical protein
MVITLRPAATIVAIGSFITYKYHNTDVTLDCNNGLLRYLRLLMNLMYYTLVSSFSFICTSNYANLCTSMHKLLVTLK